jgi:hypothetical protein
LSAAQNAAKNVQGLCTINGFVIPPQAEILCGGRALLQVSDLCHPTMDSRLRGNDELEHVFEDLLVGQKSLRFKKTQLFHVATRATPQIMLFAVSVFADVEPIETSNR